jgi:hypothetical protein
MAPDLSGHAARVFARAGLPCGCRRDAARNGWVRPGDTATVLHYPRGDSEARAQLRRKDGLVGWTLPRTAEGQRVLVASEPDPPLLFETPVHALSWEVVRAVWDSNGEVTSRARLRLTVTQRPSPSPSPQRGGGGGGGGGAGAQAAELRFEEPGHPAELAKVGEHARWAALSLSLSLSLSLAPGAVQPLTPRRGLAGAG